MRGSRMFALTISACVALLSLGFASAAEPSQGCNNGAVPPNTTPLGAGVNVTGDPTTGPGTVRACNNGTAVPAPAKGAVTVSGNPTGQSGYAEVDGDAGNTGAPCTDGFARVAVSGSGPAFYGSPDGAWTTSSPNKSPDAWLSDIANSCAGPLPAP